MELILGGLGLALALYQIRKAEKAADAAREAVVDVYGDTNRFTFLLLVPELALVEHNLDRAIAASHKDDTLRLLRDWLSRASELRGLLDVFQLPSDALKEAVSESIGQASTAHTAVSKGKPVAPTAVKARKLAEQVILQARSDAQGVRANIVPRREKTTFMQDVGALAGQIKSKISRTDRIIENA